MNDELDRFGLCPLHHPAFCELRRRGFLELVAVAGATLSVAGQAAAADQAAPPLPPPAPSTPTPWFSPRASGT